jgi:hypothetical protein
MSCSSTSINNNQYYIGPSGLINSSGNATYNIHPKPCDKNGSICIDGDYSLIPATQVLINNEKLNCVPRTASFGTYLACSTIDGTKFKTFYQDISDCTDKNTMLVRKPVGTND